MCGINEHDAWGEHGDLGGNRKKKNIEGTTVPAATTAARWSDVRRGDGEKACSRRLHFYARYLLVLLLHRAVGSFGFYFCITRRWKLVRDIEQKSLVCPSSTNGCRSGRLDENE